MPAAAGLQPLSVVGVQAMQKILTGCFQGCGWEHSRECASLVSWAPADRSPSPWVPEVGSAVMEGKTPGMGEGSKLGWTQGTEVAGQCGLHKLPGAWAVHHLQ